MSLMLHRAPSSSTGRAGSLTAAQRRIQRRIHELGDWFQNLDLEGVPTAPQHFLGNYPQLKWRQIAPALPERLDGASVLDIGCNAGFYAFECKKRGAARVLGVDADSRYLEQARFAAEVLGLQVEFRRLSVYDVGQLGEQFDYVLFLGLFYHLRYPVYALDLVVNCVRQRLVFQSMLRGPDLAPGMQPAPDYDFWNREPFGQPGFPCLYFIEQCYASDPTNWWVPNRAAVEGLLRSAGLTIVAHPEPETWVCEPTSPPPAPGESIWHRELAGTL